MLNRLEFGDIGTAIPLLIVHGLFGQARNWNAIAKRLARGRPVVSVDMRNHGDSPHLPVHDYTALAGDLAEVIADIGGQADVLGHSMGGKAAMALALSAPNAVRRLCVADIAPVTYSHTQSGVIAAMRTVDLSTVTRRGDADGQLAQVLDDPMMRAFLLQSLDLTGDAPRWKLNLDALEDQMPQIIGFPDVTGRFDGPSWFVRGETSDYVLPEHHGLIRALFPGAVFQTVAGAGHWVHAEAPAAFLETLSEGFLS